MGHGGDGAIDIGGISLDRSDVHILLCDRDPETGMEVMRLLQRCSYKVTCVKSAGQVIEVLDSASVEVDLVLAELELPKEKGFKLLKHIMRQEQLRRIPVVMMSAQDEMSLVMRCLRLGAVDFLLKPLRCNELLNLWTHTWRRRRMLGITEKHLLKGNLRVPFDLLLSETSESNNTNSTNLFSDDTDDPKIPAAPENCASSHELESEVSPQLELSLKPSIGATLEVAAKHGHSAGIMPSPPRKTSLKLGQSSAFLTYSKVINQPSRQPVDEVHFDGNTSSMHISTSRSQLQSPTQGNKNSALTMADAHGHELVKSPYRSSSSVPSSGDHVIRKPPPLWDAVPPPRIEILEKQSSEHVAPSEQAAPSHPDSTEGRVPFVNYYSQECAPNTSSVSTLSASPFVGGSVMGSVLHCSPMLSQSIQLYRGLQTDDGIAAGVPAIHVQPTHGLNIPSFPFYPFGLHMPPAHQVGSFPGWHPTPVNQLLERKLGKSERREAALHKFRLKRKDRCFEKKIRYASRKKLAEQRPRIRGQFVRRETDTDLNENGMADYYDDEDDEDQGLCEVGDGSSPESIAEDA